MSLRPLFFGWGPPSAKAALVGFESPRALVSASPPPHRPLSRNRTLAAGEAGVAEPFTHVLS